MPEISIIVPVYNVEKYLSRCIDSILCQTFTNFELILVDDGSTDKSGIICDQYKKRDNRIKVIHKENEGVSKARNIGLNKAIGKYVMFCDSDDWVEKDWVTELRMACINNNCDFSISAFNWIDIKNNIFKVKKYEEYHDDIVIPLNKIFELRKSDIFNVLWNKIFSLKVIKSNNINFDETISFGEDTIFILQYMRIIEGKIGIIDKPLYNYIYKTGNNLASKYHKDIFSIYKRLFEELYVTSIKVDVKFENYSKDYYSSYFSALLRALDNTMSKYNTDVFFEKIKTNSNIMKSIEFTTCISNADLSGYNNLFILMLKSKSYFLFLTFNKAYEFKLKIERRRKYG